MKGKVFLILVGIIAGLLVCTNKVLALENDSILKTEYIDNVYAYHYKNGVLMSYGKLPYRYQNSVLGYCIEPWTIIGTYTYSSTNDWSKSGYSDDEKKQMELIAHYGYGYEGHNTLEYYMATQELIWLFKDDYVKWTSEYTTNGSGTQINVDKEKNEIMNLVSRHNILPSFSSSCYTQYVGDKLVINDTNNVLDNYDIVSDLEYTKNGSTITFNVNKLGTFNVSLTTKNVSNSNTKVYYSTSVNTQKMAVFGLSDVKSTNITIYSNKVHVRINKRDSITKDLIKEEGTIFKVKNLDNDTYINENLTVTDGYAYIDLEKGNYIIEEVSASTGYVVNKENTKIQIDDDIVLNDGYYDVDIYNDVPTGEIKINKVDEEGNSLDGVEIGLYDEDYNMLSTIITNEDTDNLFRGLSLGTYYVKELNTLEGFMLDNNYYRVDLKYKNDTTYTIEKDLTIVNEKIKCDIVYITASENEKLKDVEINVYNENDEIVFTGKTDENGKIIIENLPYGKYYIKQVRVPSGYILNDEEYIFYVNDSTCQSTINVEIEKTIMPVTSMSFNEYLIFGLIALSIGFYNFVKKSN